MCIETWPWQDLPRGRVRRAVVERVGWIQLCAPPANNTSLELLQDLDEAILAHRFDPEVDVLVLTGAGERFFCAGADIGILREAEPAWKAMFCLYAAETLDRLERTPKPVVAALNGHCVGGGLEIALACDLRWVREAPEGGPGLKIGLPELRLGLLPGTGGTQRLARLLGKARALELILEGTLLGPEEARERGLAEAVLPAEGFLEAVQERARRWTRPQGAPLAAGAVKRAIQAGPEAGLEVGQALERELQARLFQSQDAREGLHAFLEKREPRFEGR